MSERNERVLRAVRRAGRRAGPAVVVLVAIGIGMVLHAWFWPGGGEARPGATAATAPGEAPVTQWTCSMHPEIRRSEPGLCPKCGMPLIPVRPTRAEGLREFAVTDAAKALMDIEVAPVERKFVEAEVRMVGKVDYDETRLAYITAWVPGRLDKLYVDYTGVPVKQGDHMVYIYSPELLSAQAELLQAIEAVKDLKASEVGIVRETAEATVVAAREKLRLLGLKPEQIAEIEKTGKASDHLTIYSPASGIVVEKEALEGMYVQTGARIYTVADLSQVWVKLDAYESDLMWLRYGQKVEFTTVSYPGETFTGTAAFIDPVLTSQTRTVKVRVNAANASGRLKPGMFVKAVVRARVAAGGKVMDPDLAGKWMCPMHPDVVKDAPGECDICKMPLVRTESLGYVSVAAKEEDAPLVIPASAVLKTGTRAIVYVQKPGASEPTYEGREVVLGPRAGEYYLVRGGLAEGEHVVVRGNFKIDSALQILARPSMMSPEGGAAAGGHAHHGAMPAASMSGQEAKPVQLPVLFAYQADQVLQAAARIEQAVSKGQTTDAIRAAFAELGRKLAAVDPTVLEGHALMLWKEYSMRLGNDAVEGKEATQPRDVARVAESLARNARAMKERLGLGREEGPATRPAGDPRFLEALRPIFAAYLRAHEALAADRSSDAAGAAREASAALARVDMTLLQGADHAAWMRDAEAIRKAAAGVAESKDIAAARASFALWSEQMAAVARRFGAPAGATLFQVKCPMAFDNRGATWLQSDTAVRNPYFGAAMPRCGEVVDVIRAPASAGEGGPNGGHERHQ